MQSQEFYDSILPLSNRLYRFAYRLAHNERDAEDLVQDTLLRAYTKFEQYQSGTSPLAWLLTILRSIFINKYRKKKREGNVISFEDVAAGEDRISTPDYHDLPDSPDEMLFRNMLDSELREALEQLPKHYLEVILLVDMEDMSYRETSEILQIPAGTVMSRLHRARKILQGQLQELAVKKGIVKQNVRPIFDKDKRGTGGVKHGS
jgi:RNA polymerase sigma-70 factor (ECF subfamily)